MDENKLFEQLTVACQSGGYDMEIAIQNLIKHIDDVSKTLEIVVHQAFKYLELFEQDNQDILYPRVLLTQIQNQNVINLSQFNGRNKYAHSHSDLGSNLFDASLDYLEDAYNAIQVGNVSKAKALLSIGLNNLIGAFIQRFWLNNSPETYDIWRRSANESVDEKTYSKVKSYQRSSAFTTYRQTLCDSLVKQFSDMLNR